MKRSTGISMAVIALALALSVDSAKAQGYYHRGRGNGSSIAAGIIGGIVAGAIVGAILSSSDRRAMDDAYPRVYDEEVEDGYRAEFEGDGHRGYYEVVNQGYHPSYNTCRQIRTVVYDRYGRPVAEYANRRNRFVCLNIRTNRWIDVDNYDYTIRPRPRAVARQPYGSYYVSPRPAGPRYAPYVGGTTVPGARQYAPPIAGPAQPGGFNRPSGPAPGVLPAMPQTVR